MPARNILCTLYRVHPLWTQCAIRESRRDKFHFFHPSRRNDASISKHCVTRSLSPFSRFVIISIDYYTTMSNGKKGGGGMKKINRRKWVTIGKNDVRYLFIARDTSHNVETSLRIFGRGSTDGEKRVRPAALFRSTLYSLCSVVSFIMHHLIKPTHRALRESCAPQPGGMLPKVIGNVARWPKRESLSAVTGNFRWRTCTANFAELLHNTRACRHCGLR